MDYALGDRSVRMRQAWVSPLSVNRAWEWATERDRTSLGIAYPLGSPDLNRFHRSNAPSQRSGVDLRVRTLHAR